MRVCFPVKGKPKADPEKIHLVGWVLKLESRDARGRHPDLFGPRSPVQHLVERLRCRTLWVFWISSRISSRASLFLNSALHVIIVSCLFYVL